MYKDLNPASYKFMVRNAELNKCSAPYINCYNMCGREFIDELLRHPNTCKIDHVLMNLPQSATDFLDVFIGYNRKRPADNETDGRCDVNISRLFSCANSSYFVDIACTYLLFICMPFRHVWIRLTQPSVTLLRDAQV